ncbi:tellurite resistance TerB family protein [Frigidibacter sp. SD6-1]|uniref:tellurite resistance TerB family protein n=1 Tax=Frigidibacter sp. SD6-1 TaxID=3032581 RepID=UPI0024DF4C77|nr:tellurite resistance TerB family protein [Frigidibacter sp. SD6-1]
MLKPVPAAVSEPTPTGVSAARLRRGGGLNDILGKLGGPGGGGLGDLLGGILGGAAAGPASRGFGETLNDAFRNGGEPTIQPSRSQEAAAALMLKAMIQAAKADGRIDEAEKKRLMDNLGGATAEEMAFVKRELAAPVDVRGLVAQVPDGLQAQVYTMSLMAIDLDSRAEGRYLMELANALGLTQREVTAIHSHVGAAIGAR